MTQLTVTLKTLMEIDQIACGPVIQEIIYEEDDACLYDKDDNCLEIPYIAFGTTITLDNYEWEYKLCGSGNTVSLKVDPDSPKEIRIFKELIKRVVKGSIPNIQTFDLSNNVLSYNSKNKIFKCGCETISLDRAKELVDFMNNCINTAKPLRKRKS